MNYGDAILGVECALPARFRWERRRKRFRRWPFFARWLTLPGDA